MTTNNEDGFRYAGSEVLYVLTMEDLEQTYNDWTTQDDKHTGEPQRFEDLPLEERKAVTHTVKKYIEGWADESMYNWNDAIQDGIETYYRDKARDEGRSDAKVQS